MKFLVCFWLLALNFGVFAFNYADFVEGNSYEVEVVNYNEGSKCPKIKQPLCGTNGKEFVYFENQCEFELKNYERLIQGLIEYYECPLSFCKLTCPKCDAVKKPICAVNMLTGETEDFPNPCEVERKMCATKAVWQIVDSYACNFVKENKLVQPTGCPKYCTVEHQPICARFRTLEREFSNDCELQTTICQTKQKWTIVRRGPCKSLNYKTGADHSPAHVDLQQADWRLVTQSRRLEGNRNTNTKVDLRPQNLKCSQICTLEYGPVCAQFRNQLRQFSSNCELEQTICDTSEAWKVISLGSCTSQAFHIWPQAALCTKQCSNDYKPVCAKFKFQLREFWNECELLKLSCETNTNWQLLKTGRCPLVSIGKSACNSLCTKEFSPVCASYNGELREFFNICELHKQTCETNTAWKLLSKSPCSLDQFKKPQGIACDHEVLDPICATNGLEMQTFNNSCLFAQEIKSSENYWAILYKGACTYSDATATTNSSVNQFKSTNQTPFAFTPISTSETRYTDSAEPVSIKKSSTYCKKPNPENTSHTENDAKHTTHADVPTTAATTMTKNTIAKALTITSQASSSEEVGEDIEHNSEENKYYSYGSTSTAAITRTTMLDTTTELPSSVTSSGNTAEEITQEIEENCKKYSTNTYSHPIQNSTSIKKGYITGESRKKADNNSSNYEGSTNKPHSSVPQLKTTAKGKNSLAVILRNSNGAIPNIKYSLVKPSASIQNIVDQDQKYNNSSTSSTRLSYRERLEDDDYNTLYDYETEYPDSVSSSGESDTNDSGTKKSKGQRKLYNVVGKSRISPYQNKLKVTMPKRIKDRLEKLLNNLETIVNKNNLRKLKNPEQNFAKDQQVYKEMSSVGNVESFNEKNLAEVIEQQVQNVLNEIKDGLSSEESVSDYQELPYQLKKAPDSKTSLVANNDEMLKTSSVSNGYERENQNHMQDIELANSSSSVVTEKSSEEKGPKTREKISNHSLASEEKEEQHLKEYQSVYNSANAKKNEIYNGAVYKAPFYDAPTYNFIYTAPNHAVIPTYYPGAHIRLPNENLLAPIPKSKSAGTMALKPLQLPTALGAISGGFVKQEPHNSNNYPIAGEHPPSLVQHDHESIIHKIVSELHALPQVMPLAPLQQVLNSSSASNTNFLTQNQNLTSFKQIEENENSQNSKKHQNINPSISKVYLQEVPHGLQVDLNKSPDEPPYTPTASHNSTLLNQVLDTLKNLTNHH